MKEMRFTNTRLQEPNEDGTAEFVIVGERNGIAAEERFTILDTPPLAAVEILVDGGSVIEYVRLCLEPTEEARFNALLADKSFRVEKQTIRDVYHGLIEHYTDRPTGAPTGSGPGRESTEESSTVDSSSQESISTNSE